MKVQVPVGPTSVIGWLTAALSVVPAVVNAVEGADLSGPGKWLAIFGIVSLAITQIGRYLQAPQASKTK